MKLKRLIKRLGDYRLTPGIKDFEARGISCNSKNIKNDFIFVAIKGNRQDGNKFIDEAVSKGAKAVVVQSPQYTVHNGVAIIGVKDTRKAAAKLAAEFYGNPSRKLKVVGITGTNGKTTVAYLIEAILKKAGFNPAVIGTINYRFKDKIIPSKNTTPGPIEIHGLLSDMAKKGAQYAVMEVSSHALDQERVEGINFHSAIFTNLTQDHLDYHKTKERYFRAKLKLFKSIGPGSFAVINNDDAYASRVKKSCPKDIITYAIDKKADARAENIKFSFSHTEFLLTSKNEETAIKTKLIGRHNIYNILAAVSWAKREGIAAAPVKSALRDFSFVPGRLQRIDSGTGFSVFVDYAHTEDALKNAINALRELSPRNIIVVFGCGGERDRTKRPKMGRVVTELADYTVITNDNPRSEDPREIINSIKKGIRKNNYCVIPDRVKAIGKSLSLAGRGDIVLVAGKGHENYQVLKDMTVPFDDRRVIKECLKSANS